MSADGMSVLEMFSVLFRLVNRIYAVAGSCAVAVVDDVQAVKMKSWERSG